MRRRQTTFYCFSPPVMIATFIVEVSLAVYAWWRYRLTPISRLTMFILLLLATFQLAEYQVCQGSLSSAQMWSRIGYVAIAFLPPLGLHLLCTLAGERQRLALGLGYGAATVFAGFFLLAPGALSGHACMGNYVIFQVAHSSGALFGAYYYGLLCVGIGLGRYYLRRGLPAPTQRAIRGLMLGYLVFIVPTVLVNLMRPNTVQGIPSIMCGFAVLLAVTLAFVVLPATVSKKREAL